MITETDIDKIDRARIYSIYDNWPEHFRKALEIKVKIDHDVEFYDSIALCGMGASATGCDILGELLLNASRIPYTILKGQSIPRYIGRRSLVIANSVSGNTQETINMMKEADSTNAEVICISSGGELKELAEKYGHKHIQIPNLSVPRASLPYLMMPGLRIVDPFLKNSIVNDIISIPETLDKISKTISLEMPERSNVSKQIAEFSNEGFIFCFTSPALLCAATRFKNSLNENAKMHCIRESVLEASHNEIVPFTFNNSIRPRILFLKWAGDMPIVKERFTRIQGFCQKISQPVMDLDIRNKSVINAIVSSIYILDYATIYMAVTRKIDPSPTPAIDILKKEGNL